MTDQPHSPNKGNSSSRGRLFWLGWAFTVLPALFLLFGAFHSLVSTDAARAGMAEMGYPESVAGPIGIVLLVCTILYLLPNTATLGAILLTGYLGGAVATHVRVGDPIHFTLMPVVFGAVLWLGLFFRDSRVRALVPWRSTPTQPVQTGTPMHRRSES
jgi:hypothetical protein